MEHKYSVEDIYHILRRIYTGEIKLTDAKKEFNKKFGMNEQSFTDYYYAYKKMMKGQLHQRTIDTGIRDFMLRSIKERYGIQQLRTALNAFIAHIEYYETLRNTTRWKDRNVYDKYQNELNLSDNMEQEELAYIIKKTKREDIIKELKALKPTDPKEIVIHSKTYLRDNKTTVQLKELRGYCCQMCQTRIPKANGSFYIEAAHITPKAEKGTEMPENILILCPNHHKEFDYGRPQIQERTKEYIRFILNGKTYEVSLKID